MRGESSSFPPEHETGAPLHASAQASSSVAAIISPYLRTADMMCDDPRGRRLDSEKICCGVRHPHP